MKLLTEGGPSSKATAVAIAVLEVREREGVLNVVLFVLFVCLFVLLVCLFCLFEFPNGGSGGGLGRVGIES